MTHSEDLADDPHRSFPPLRDAWYLTGPTAVGKTRAAIELAERIGAEIVALDSMSVYRGMDVGTAKPTREQRQRVPHHLLDLVECDRDFSLSQYIAAAHQAVRQVRERARQPLFVGGTPLYLKSLLRGVDPGPPADWEFRREVEAELAIVGIEALHRRLQQVDPLSAARLHPHDKRRIIRALEVHRLTGRPISHGQTHFDETPDETCRVIVFSRSRTELHQRIETRVERMFAAGLVAEVAGLVSRFGGLSRTAAQAVGYREVLEHLQGERDLSTTIELVKARTRQFARRQMTWFRSLAECRFIELSGEPAPQEIAERIREAAEGAPPHGDDDG